jgi:hypothetical protein
MDMENNDATGCDGIPTEARRTLVTNDEGTEILTKLSKRKGNQREAINY